MLHDCHHAKLHIQPVHLLPTAVYMRRSVVVFCVRSDTLYTGLFCSHHTVLLHCICIAQGCALKVMTLFTLHTSSCAVVLQHADQVRMRTLLSVQQFSDGFECLLQRPVVTTLLASAAAVLLCAVLLAALQLCARL
jgi:hypothetical protein